MNKKCLGEYICHILHFNFIIFRFCKAQQKTYRYIFDNVFITVGQHLGYSKNNSIFLQKYYQNIGKQTQVEHLM